MPGGSPYSDLSPLTDREFDLFRALIHREAGIQLSEAKRALLVRRLSGRLRDLGLRTFSAYYRWIRHHQPGELVRMLDCIATNETSFFREPRQFQYLTETIVPAWQEEAASGHRGRQVRAWCAACSTGEEAYTLAMVLLQHLPPRAGWRIEILASDLSTRALESARHGVWPIAKADAIPAEYRRHYMLRGVRSREGSLKAIPELRRTIRFQRINLSRADLPVTGTFDLILLRNVLIYFDLETKRRCLSRVAERLASDGYLFLGHSEALNGAAQNLRPVAPSILRACTVRRPTQGSLAGVG